MAKEKTIERRTAAKNSVGRGIFAAISILLEFSFIVLTATVLNNYAEWISLVTRLLALILVLWIYSRNQTASMKMLWIILILVFPIIGTVMFLIIGLAKTPKKMQERFNRIDSQLYPMLAEDPEAAEAAGQYDLHLASISSYLKKNSSFPLYHDSEICYYPEASLGLQAQMDELRKAKHFIFMEYHAIENAESWYVLQDILAAKAKAGVEVRVFYDDMGSIGFLNQSFIRQMEELGIQCRVFNPIVPIVNMFLNNRDHRKITVIDGVVGFTGGYNLANEYFNLTHPYGQWKDSGVKITGPAVRSLTVMFLEMWNAIRECDVDDTEFDRYLPQVPPVRADHPGFIQPYADIPTDGELVGENVYISLINQAVDYIYFTTPYLIITDEMIRAISLAAKRGVDVRIITPGIPDKKMVYNVTRSYYYSLVRNGVRIYEYTPGFLHAKQCVSDDKAAVCGTINLDYRSLYHHFENAVLFYDCPAVMDVKKDFYALFPQCREVTKEYALRRSAPWRLGNLVLRLFSPLL